MLVCTGYVSIIPEVEILNLPMLTRVLERIYYGKGKAQWELVGSMVHITANTDIPSLRAELEHYCLILPEGRSVVRELA